MEDLENVKPLVQRASKRGSFEIITQHYHTVLLRQISFQMCRIYLPPYEKIECTNRTSANQYNYMGQLVYCPFQNSQLGKVFPTHLYARQGLEE